MTVLNFKCCKVESIWFHQYSLVLNFYVTEDIHRRLITLDKFYFCGPSACLKRMKHFDIIIRKRVIFILPLQAPLRVSKYLSLWESSSFHLLICWVRQWTYRTHTAVCWDESTVCGYTWGWSLPWRTESLSRLLLSIFINGSRNQRNRVDTRSIYHPSLGTQHLEIPNTYFAGELTLKWTLAERLAVHYWRLSR